MKNRSLAQPIEELAFGAHKMALVSGPRQCGKTTLARMLLRGRTRGTYHNWDEVEFRRAWAKSPSTVLPKPSGRDTPLVVLDEIHKDRRWKRNLKGVFDTLTSPCDILVTGSARLNVYMKGSDSLLGRHYSFRLHPFSIRELERTDVLGPDAMLQALFGRTERMTRAARGNLAAILTYGPFPEPLLAQNIRTARLWRRNREQLIVREDLRDLSRLPELGRIEMLTALLLERVGTPASLASLAEDLETSIPTVKRWLGYLKELYYLFEVKPYVRQVPRSLRKEGKVYLWDYSGVKDESARYENLVACHLLKACHYWSDTGEGEFELFYIRDKDQHEIDFLIVRDGVPWLPVEAKLGETTPAANWARFARVLPCARALQVVNRPVWDEHAFGDKRLLVADAAEALRYFA
ncbi:MAG: ATP-binding protein [Planctomycetota bacterium]|nr:ATP-binding protein [Planctomycetota bacterium]